jgi:hypothetical protein
LTAVPEAAPSDAPAAAALSAVPAVAAGAATGGKGRKGSAKGTAPTASRRQAQTAADPKQEAVDFALQNEGSSGEGRPLRERRRRKRASAS